jgi:hypothetical protein
VRAARTIPLRLATVRALELPSWVQAPMPWRWCRGHSRLGHRIHSVQLSLRRSKEPWVSRAEEEFLARLCSSASTAGAGVARRLYPRRRPPAQGLIEADHPFIGRRLASDRRMRDGLRDVRLEDETEVSDLAKIADRGRMSARSCSSVMRLMSVSRADGISSHRLVSGGKQQRKRQSSVQPLSLPRLADRSPYDSERRSVHRAGPDLKSFGFPLSSRSQRSATFIQRWNVTASTVESPDWLIR